MLLHKRANAPVEPERVRLELSGPALASALANVATGAEELGGIERYAEALDLKSQMFKDVLGGGKVRNLDLEQLMGLCVFMSTVRRRIAPYLDPDGFRKLKAALYDLVILDVGLPDTDGRSRDIAEWDGKVLVINFWATWCPPCVHEIPVFSALYDEYASRGVQFLGVATHRVSEGLVGQHNSMLVVEHDQSFSQCIKCCANSVRYNRRRIDRPVVVVGR